MSVTLRLKNPGINESGERSYHILNKKGGYIRLKLVWFCFCHQKSMPVWMLYIICIYAQKMLTMVGSEW